MVRFVPPIMIVSLLATGELAFDSQPFLKLVFEFGALGVLAWWCWHSTKIAMPKLTKDYREEAQASRKGHREDIVVLTEHHDKVVDRMFSQWSDTQKENHEDSMRAVGAIQELAARCSDVVNEVRKENGKS